MSKPKHKRSKTDAERERLSQAFDAGVVRRQAGGIAAPIQNKAFYTTLMVDGALCEDVVLMMKEYLRGRDTENLRSIDDGLSP